MAIQLRVMSRSLLAGALGLLMLGAAGCGTADPDTVYPRQKKYGGGGGGGTYAPKESVFGEGGLDLFGGGDAQDDGAGGIHGLVEPDHHGDIELHAWQLVAPHL